MTATTLERTATAGRTDANPAVTDPITITLARDDYAPKRARSFVGDVLAAHGATDDARDDGKLLVSEVVTNSVTHTDRGDIAVTVALIGHRLARIAVHDGGTGTPEAHDAADDDEHGRGLTILHAIAEDHGCNRDSKGSTCWFSIALDGSAS